MRSNRHNSIAVSVVCCLISFIGGLIFVSSTNSYDLMLELEPVSDEDYPGQKSGLTGTGLDPSMGTAGWVTINRAYLKHYPKYAKQLKENWTDLPKEVWKGIVPE